MFCPNMPKTLQELLKTTVSRSRVDNEVFTAKLKPTSKNRSNQRIYSYLFVSIFLGCVSIRIYPYLFVSIRIYFASLNTWKIQGEMSLSIFQ